MQIAMDFVGRVPGPFFGRFNSGILRVREDNAPAVLVATALNAAEAKREKIEAERAAKEELREAKKREESEMKASKKATKEAGKEIKKQEVARAKFEKAAEVERKRQEAARERMEKTARKGLAETVGSGSGATTRAGNERGGRKDKRGGFRGGEFGRDGERGPSA